MKAATRRKGAPIAVQLVALLVVSLIAAQILTFAVIVLMPPPPRPIWRLEEVAQVLRGGAVPAGLVRGVEKAPPDEPPHHGPHMAFMRRELAALLHAPEADVRLAQRPTRATLVFRTAFEREHGVHERRVIALGAGPGADRAIRVFEHELGEGPPPMGPPPPEPPLGPDGPGHPDHMMFGLAGRGFGMMSVRPPLFGEFTAAVKRPSGDWLVVRPRPEPFPNDWQRRLLLWLGGCLLLTAPLGYLFARRITAPIGDFARAAETLGRDPSAPLMPLSGPAEIGAAARAFNEMHARLKRYIEDRTAMVGAISHDLRTPLARIRFKLERAPDEVKASVLTDVEQMEQMIASVLAFIRDASAGRPRERLDLLSLVECLVDDAAGRDVRLVSGTAVTVEADALGLQRLFGNLIDNAVKYGDCAKVTVAREADEAVVEIADEGPGLAESEMERVFQPFYRAEAARTLDGRGVGLGLAVARSIARAHGGDVTLSRGATGLVAQVRLPVSAA